MARVDTDSSSNNSARARPRKKPRLDAERTSGDAGSSSKRTNDSTATVDKSKKARPRIAKDSAATRVLKSTLSVSSNGKPKEKQREMEPQQSKVAAFDSTVDFIALAPDSDPELSTPPPQLQSKSHDDKSALHFDSRRDSSSRKRTAQHFDDPGPSSHHRYDTSAPDTTPWTWGIDWAKYNTVSEMLHAEVKAFSEYISPTEEEHETRRLVIMLIERCVRRRWYDARVVPFGSFETRLYHPLGDIDLVIQSASMERASKKNVLYKLSYALRDEGLADNIQVIAHARVPIIKFISCYGRFAVDISINQDNGIASGYIVNSFLQELPALRPLTMVVKAFLRERNMNEVYNGGLGSYSTVCLLVSFLQMHPKVRAGEIRAEDNLGTMLLEFLELYGHLFNAENVGISLRNGGSYFSKTARGWVDQRQPFLLSIEDPQDASNDVSKSSFQVRQVFRTFAGANEILTAAACQAAGALEAMRLGRYTHLRRGTQDMGLLGRIMAVDHRTMNHRNMVKAMYDAGELHMLLGVPKKRLEPPQNSSRDRRRPPSPTSLPPPPPSLPPKPMHDFPTVRAMGLDYDDDDDDDDGEQDMRLSDNDSPHSKVWASGKDKKDLNEVDDDDEQDTRYRAKSMRRGTSKGKTSVGPTIHTFTTDEEDDEVHDNELDPANVVLHTSNSVHVNPDGQPAEELTSAVSAKKNRIKIDRKRDYWAAKTRNPRIKKILHFVLMSS